MIKALPNELAEAYGITFAIAFGSQVSGQTHPQSDIDLAIKLKKPLTLKEELALTSELSQFYEKEADLCFLDENISALLYGEWAKNSQLIYGDEEEYTSFCIEALKKFLDFEPYFKLQAEQLAENLADLKKHP